MKTKILALGLVCLIPLFLWSQINEKPEEEFGFTGEVRETLLKKLHPKTESQLIDGNVILDKVKVLMVGFSSSKLDDTDSECFRFVTYYWEGSSSDRWIAIIVANYGTKAALGTKISIEVKGPKSSKIEITRVIPREAVMIYAFKFNKRFSKQTTGVYELIGMIYHHKMWTSKATTRVYIDEIW